MERESNSAGRAPREQVVVAQRLYAWSMYRCRREADTDLAFLRAAHSDALSSMLDALSSFPRGEQQRVLVAMVRIQFQAYLPLWGDRLTEDDRRHTRALADRFDRTLRPMRPFYSVSRSDKKRVVGCVRDHFRGFLDADVTCRNAVCTVRMAPGGIPIEAEFRIGRFNDLGLLYRIPTAEPVSTPPEQLFLKWWCPFRFRGLNGGISFYFEDLVHSIQQATLLIEETKAFARFLVERDNSPAA